MDTIDAVQTAIRARLVATAGVTSLVPADAILDRNARPAPDPSILLGEHQATAQDDIARRAQLIVSTVHVWKKEVSLAGVRAICAEMRTAIQDAKLHLATGLHCGDCRVSDIRTMRDPDGETSHGVVTIETLVTETD